MTTAGRTDSATSNEGEWTRSALPLLHLRGTDYDLLVHGFRKASEVRQEAGYLTAQHGHVSKGSSADR